MEMHFSFSCTEIDNLVNISLQLDQIYNLLAALLKATDQIILLHKKNSTILADINLIMENPYLLLFEICLSAKSANGSYGKVMISRKVMVIVDKQHSAERSVHFRKKRLQL